MAGAAGEGGKEEDGEGHITDPKGHCISHENIHGLWLSSPISLFSSFPSVAPLELLGLGFGAFCAI